MAVLAGNALYFLNLEPHLPEHLHHQPFRLDGGLFLDLAVCLAVFSAIRLLRKQ